MPGAGTMTTWPGDGLAAGAWGAGGGGPANPQDLNRYSYAANNPTTFNDPSGHIVFVPALILGAKAIGKGVAWLGALRPACCGSARGCYACLATYGKSRCLADVVKLLANAASIGGTVHSQPDRDR